MDLDTAWVALVLNQIPGIVPVSWSAGALPMALNHSYDFDTPAQIRTAFATDKSRNGSVDYCIAFSEEGVDFIKTLDEHIHWKWNESAVPITPDYHYTVFCDGYGYVQCYRLIFPHMSIHGTRHKKLNTWWRRLFEQYLTWKLEMSP